ncbi:MAG TPA: glycosyltransferase [Blastocatellia bacterium]|nr:glycosyltransferase [Blastocatellia bacterium]
MRILWLKTELLHPVDKGGKIRTYQMLRHINRSHDVTYLSLVRPDEPAEALARASEYCRQLIPVKHADAPKFSARFYRDIAFNLSSPLPYAIQKYRSPAMQQAIEHELRERHYDAVVCDFLTPGVNFRHDTATPAVLFQHNVESMIWQRHYETARQPLKRALFHNQWQKMLRFERETCRQFDAVVAVSAADRDQMRDEFGLRNVYDVPTGVDTEYFRPLGGRTEPAELVFTGSMDWLPNEDGICHFAETTLPLIAEAVPDVKLTVVGRNPTARLLALAEADPRITVTGRVEDVRPYIDRAAAYVVPLRIGGGTRLKIYEAMAMGKPVVSTTVGAEGLPLRDGTDLLLADEPETFARAVARTLADQSLARQLGERARALVCDRFGWQHAAESFVAICDSVVSNARKRRAA